MSLTYKFDKTGDNPEKKEGQSETGKEIERYNDAGNVRNVCFVELTGKMTFLNYAYLVAGEFKAEDNAITLIFTTHVVTLDGYGLESLYEDFMNHLPKKISCVDERYAELRKEEGGCVTRINVAAHKENY